MSDADPVHEMAPFRPRRGRVVALSTAIGSVVVFATVALLLPGPDQGGPWRPGDRILLALVGVGIAAFLWRYATIRAVPDTAGIEVRNLLQTRTIAWGEIEDVRFGGGEPWVTLDLVDADTVAVMAIQRADGPRAMDEAHRLATLVERGR